MKYVYYVYLFIYLFVVYLIAVSVSLTGHFRMVGQLIDIYTEKPVVTNCEVISQKLPGETEECHEKRQSA